MDDYQRITDALQKIPPVEGITPIDVLSLPDPLGVVIGQLIKRGFMSLPDLTEALKMPSTQARAIGDLLTRKGYLVKEYRSGKDIIYRAYIARMRKRNIPDFDF
jgi:hypothetical protein